MKDTIILAVSGSVAAYKAADLARRLMDRGLAVKVAMTEAAEKFVTPLTFESLTGRPALRAAFPGPGEDPMAHINFSRGARLLLVAPATADILGKMAHGLAGDSVTAMILACQAPVMAAPAMNTNMWTHPAVAANVQTLKSRGVEFIGPAAGALACGDVGEGKMEDVETIAAAVTRRLGVERDLAGLKILVTAGGSREPIDPVRFIGNRSSGKMGAALAIEAAKRGAEVTLIAAAMEIPLPEGIPAIRAFTAKEMEDHVMRLLKDADMLIMAAAVADWRVENPGAGKIKKGERQALELSVNPDILAAAGAAKGRRFIIGFAAETSGAEAEGRKKLLAKNLDMIVINDVSRADIGFGTDENEVTILLRDGTKVEAPKAGKPEVARAILDQAARQLSARSRAAAGGPA